MFHGIPCNLGLSLRCNLDVWTAIEQRTSMKFGSFCRTSQPAKNIVKELQLGIRQGSYGIGKFCHTFPMPIEKPFKHKALVKSC